MPATALGVTGLDSGSAAFPLREQDIVRAYARWAPVYDLVFGAVMAKGRKLAARSVPADSRDVLEVGVGTGLSLAHYPATCRVTGIDLSPDMLEGARRTVARRRLANIAALEQMDACALSFADDTFDAALAMYAVTCVQSPRTMMCEAARVVRPGGRVIVLSKLASEHGPAPFVGPALASAARWLGFSTVVTMSSLTEIAGLELVSARRVGLAGFYRLLEFQVVKA